RCPPVPPAGSSTTTAATPEPSRSSCAFPTLTPATSVIRLAISPNLSSNPRSHRCDAGLGRLALCGRLGASRGMAADVSVLAALFAGLISFLSPCVLPLVPPYLVFLAGSSLERLARAGPAPFVKRDAIGAVARGVGGG